LHLNEMIVEERRVIALMKHPNDFDFIISQCFGEILISFTPTVTLSSI